jgi:hypothetical protein
MSCVKVECSNALLWIWALCLFGGMILVLSMGIEDGCHLLKDYLTNK